jgi:Ca-activated chloride channel family protein
MKYAPLFLMLVLTAAAEAQSVREHLSEGNRYYKQTLFEQAEAAYRRALEADGGNTTAQYNLANTLQKLRKYDEAAQLLERLYAAAEAKDLKANTAYNQGVAFTKQKKLDESIEAYKKALRLNPNDQQARENLQKALKEKKQQQQQQQQQQSSSSSMDQRNADQKLKQLQEKEKQLQQRLQNQRKQQGGGGGKDW